MKTAILDIAEFKKFTDGRKPAKEQMWSGKDGNINLVCMKPDQEIITHTHHGSHIWVVMEGEGELFSAGKKERIGRGKIVVVPPLVDHGIRNTGPADLVIASFTASGD